MSFQLDVVEKLIFVTDNEKVCVFVFFNQFFDKLMVFNYPCDFLGVLSSKYYTVFLNKMLIL